MDTVGFIGLGRLGSQIASSVLDAGYAVVCSPRGRVGELVDRGARVVGDGSPRAVAQAADVVLTCLPASALPAVFLGDDGLLTAAGAPPIVVDLSTASLAVKEQVREAAAARGGEVLDCPVSGTPSMVAAGNGVIYASGARPAYERVGELLGAVSSNVRYLGAFGTGTKTKLVANLLALVHATATAEAMAFAAALGLDLDEVVEIVAASPAAVSGQFTVRAPLIARGRFDGDLVTVKDAREVLDNVTGAAATAGSSVPLTTTAKRLLDEFGARGEDESDPGKLALFLGPGRSVTDDLR